MEPTFLTVAENLKPHGIKFGKVDIEEEKTLKTRFSIEQLPWILMFRKGIMYKYEGPLGVSGPEGIVIMIVICNKLIIDCNYFRNNQILSTREREGLPSGEPCPNID